MIFIISTLCSFLSEPGHHYSGGSVLLPTAGISCWLPLVSSVLPVQVPQECKKQILLLNLRELRNKTVWRTPLIWFIISFQTHFHKIIEDCENWGLRIFLAMQKFEEILPNLCHCLWILPVQNSQMHGVRMTEVDQLLGLKQSSCLELNLNQTPL